MSALKHAADLETHAKQVKNLIGEFYEHAISKAKRSTETETSIQLEGYGDFYDSVTKTAIKFTAKDKDDLLTGLRELFPDSLVEYQILSRGDDGKMYDISKMDDTTLSWGMKYLSKEYLVIDWS